MLRIQSGISLYETASFSQNLISNALPTFGKIVLVALAALAAFALAIVFHQRLKMKNQGNGKGGNSSKLTDDTIKTDPLNQGGNNKTNPIKATSFQQIEDIYTDIAQKAFTDPNFSAVHALKNINSPDCPMGKQIKSLLKEIKSEFENKYSYELSGRLEIGSSVPEYFANTSGFESSVERKYRSLVGICNLFEKGPSIIDDFRDKKFIGGIHHYDHMKGLNAFKYYTGNTVDLDMELDAKNSDDALNQAKELIVKFGEACGLTPRNGSKLTAKEVESQLFSRKLKLPQSTYDIHDSSQSHTDRSNHGIWMRSNPKGGTFYYVNVPNIDLIMVATLKLPYMLAELVDKAKKFENGKLYKEFCNAFFEEGLSDACFNDKARAMINFHFEWKAKLEGALSPEDEARKKIADGLFGEALKLKGPDEVMKEAVTRDKLIDQINIYGIECNGLSFEEWCKNYKTQIRTILVDSKQWETILYQREKDADYFLLNESTLNSFIVDYHKYLYDSGL